MKLGAVGRTGESQLSHLHYFSCQAKHFSEQKELSQIFVACPGGGTSTVQGGAICAADGANVEINACTFERNQAISVSAF